MNAGLLIAFEGGDGAGKSTQVHLLALAISLADPDREIITTRQPGGTELGASIRELLLHGKPVSPRAEALLFAADKAQHVAELIRPGLDRGATVITDRYVDSSVAYQGAGRSLGADEVRELQLWAVEHIEPDLTIVIDLPTALGRQRRGLTQDRLEAEADSFHEAIRQHFLAVAHDNPTRYHIVDGSQPPEAVHAQVLERLGPLLERQS